MMLTATRFCLVRFLLGIRYLFFMLAGLREGGSEQAGGHGNDAESCDEHKACENTSAKRDGDGIAITDGGQCNDGPPKAVKHGGIDLGLSLIFKMVDAHGSEVEHDQGRRAKQHQFLTRIGKG